ncbi:hypothetical protein DV736_g4347, partial [Chaetothyriales sp. CBS 134916]
MVQEKQVVEAQHSVNTDYAVATTANVEESHLDPTPRAVDSSHPLDCDGATTNKDNQCKDASNQSWLTRYQLNDIVHTEERLRPQDRSSAPPESLRVLGQQEAVRMNNYLDRFSADILPPPNLPVYLQILTYMQRWGLWAAHIQDDERRRELIKVIAEKMENVWLVGMRQGLIPQNLDKLNAQNEETTALRPSANYQFNHKLAADILGTHVHQHQGSKRVVSPSHEIVIKYTWKGKPKYPVTVGELEEAGLTMKEIEQRLLSADLHDDHDILEEILERLNRDICEGDWYRITQCTPYNPIGRDLEIYCLWEMQSLRRDLRNLERLKQGFKFASQVKNTQVRIDSAKTLYDQYDAMASLLHDKKTKRTPPRSRAENASAEPEVDHCADTISSDISIQSSGEAVFESGPATQNDESASVDLTKDTPSSSQQKLGFPITAPSDEGRDKEAHLPHLPTIKLLVQKPYFKINLKTKPGFLSEDHSTRTVNNLRGFRWRYFKDSTLAERESMDEIIHNYVGSPGNRQRDHVPYRFGLYQVFSRPNKADNNKPIVHGIWDTRNKIAVEGADRFYNGEDEEWPIQALQRDADLAHFLGGR